MKRTRITIPASAGMNGNEQPAVEAFRVGMRRDYLFLESGVFGYGARAADVARELGYRPVMLARDPSEYARAVIDPRPHMDEIVTVDTFDTAKLLRIVIERRPAAVLALDDYRLLQAAMLSGYAGRDFRLAEGLVNTRFKDRMRGLLTGTEFEVAYAAHDLDRDPPRLSAVGYPCVVKPVDEAGSSGVRICYDDADFGHAVGVLRETLGAPNSRGYRASRGIVVEAFIPGQEYSAEVVYDPSAERWRLVGVTRKLVTDPPFCVEAGHVFPAELGRETGAEVERALDRVLLRLGLRNTVAHVEFKLDGGRIQVIEVNPRLGGDMLAELVESAHGIDLIAIAVRLHAGHPIDDLLTPTRRLVAGIRFLFAPRPGIVTALRVPDAPLAGEVRRRLPVLPRTVQTVASSADRMGFVVFAAVDARTVEESIARYLAACEFVYGD